jgi:hypothetical protein
LKKSVPIVAILLATFLLYILLLMFGAFSRAPAEGALVLAAPFLLYVFAKILTKVSFFERIIAKTLAKVQTPFSSEAAFAVDAKRFKEEEVAHRQYRKRWWLPLPFAFLAAITSPVFLSSSGLAIALVILIVLSITIGLVIHVSGGQRYIKYEFLVYGISAGTYEPFLTGAYLVAREGSSSLSGRALLVGSFVIYVIFLGAVRIFPALRIGPPGCFMPSSRRLFFWVKRSGFVFALISLGGGAAPMLVTPYLILRYILGERMSEAPILYLRSFHYGEGPTAFGKIVARVASRYGVLRALVHETQGPLELHAQTRLTERANFTRVPDADWQDWIRTEMLRASAIIIDRSVPSEGLSWELDQALKHAEPPKIILLTKQGTVASTPPNIWNIEYEMGKNGERQARKKLDERLRTVFHLA